MVGYGLVDTSDNNSRLTKENINSTSMKTWTYFVTES